ncbi:MAG TPA: phosphotransferase [Candidatus Angelobacter sp.]|nr:phosphotransferase [Candidatus Angelobacter sp.]
MRWLLPAGKTQIDAVLANWTPYRLGSRLGWAAARAATRIGCMDVLPGVAEVDVAGPSRAEWESVAWRWGGNPLAVIYVGTPCARRKAVVHLVEAESGKCRAVVKVPLAEQAKDAILHEAEVLGALEGERMERVPRLLHVDRERAVTAQTFVEGRSGSRRLGPEHWRLLRSLLLPGETTSLSAHAEELRRGAAIAGSAAERLQDDTSLPACWEHGDFAPWNVRLQADDACILLDWEQARRNGLPLMDAFHFLHLQDFLFGERPRLYWATVQAEAAELGIEPSAIRGLEMAYLMRASAECACERNERRLGFVQAALRQFERKAA